MSSRDSSEDLLFFKVEMEGLLKHTFALFRQAFVPLAILYFAFDLILMALAGLVGWLMQSSDLVRQLLKPAAWEVAGLGVGALTVYLLTFASFLIAASRMDGKELPKPALILGSGLLRLPWVVVGLLVAILLIALGLMLLVIPGFMVGVALSVLWPVLFLEDRAFDAIHRTFDLTRGHRWTLFWFFLVMGLISGAGSLISAIFPGFLSWIVGNVLIILDIAALTAAYGDLRTAADAEVSFWQS